VTVSYFEWLKNLSHVRFGRLERRVQAAAGERLLDAIQSATGTTFNDTERSRLVRVTDELTIVNSGLEDTMIAAYHELRAALREHPAMGDLRTAAFFVAIEKIARAYLELGIFP
jgi:glutamate dehydrogenase (NAD(P)+)